MEACEFQDDPLVCPADRSVVETYISSLGPKLPRGCDSLGGRPGKVGGVSLWGTGPEHPQPDVQDSAIDLSSALLSPQREARPHSSSPRSRKQGLKSITACGSQILIDPKCGNVSETPDGGLGWALNLSLYLVYQEIWSSQNCSRSGFLDSMSTGTRVLFGSGVAPKALLLKAWSLTFGPIRGEVVRLAGGGAYVRKLGHEVGAGRLCA